TRRGKDILPVESPSQLRTAILPNPFDPLRSLASGQAFRRARRKVVDVPASKGKDEQHRVTVVLYDVSGSMDGDPAIFQANLIAAFVAHAASDVSKKGKFRHKVVIIPFGQNPHTDNIRYVNDAPTAQVIIDNPTKI